MSAAVIGVTQANKRSWSVIAWVELPKIFYKTMTFSIIKRHLAEIEAFNVDPVTDEIESRQATIIYYSNDVMS